MQKIKYAFPLFFLLLIGCGLDVSLDNSSDGSTSDGSDNSQNSSELLQVDVASDGSLGNGVANNFIDVSDSGQYVVFSSVATNLVADDTNSVSDVFVRDLVNKTTVRVSVASDGTEGNATSDRPAISGDGKIIYFRSNATNLVAGDTNSTSDIFRHVLATGVTDLVSKSQAGVLSTGFSNFSSTNYVGDKVVFDSKATNLTAITTTVSRVNTYLKNMNTGAVTLLTEARVAGVRQGFDHNHQSGKTAISRDGSSIVFHGSSTDLVDDADANGALRDIFEYNVNTDQVQRISEKADGTQGTENHWLPRPSSNGQYVTFHTNSSQYPPLNHSGTWGTFRKNLATGEVERASSTYNGEAPNGDCNESGITGDGNWVVFDCDSDATNYIPQDSNGKGDIFAKDFSTGEIVLVSKLPFGIQLNDDSQFPHINIDGTIVVFTSKATNIPDSSTDGLTHIFVKSMTNIKGD